VTARETAERHAQDVVDGNLARLASDFEEKALAEYLELGVLPPQPTTEWTIVSETPDGDLVRFQIRYANDSEHLVIKTTWQQLDGDWKIINAFV
jgi:hypothetical protein